MEGKSMKKGWVWAAALAVGVAVSASAAEKKAEAGAAAAPAGFKTTLNAGLTLTDGNSETMAANASPSRKPMFRLRMSFTGRAPQSDCRPPIAVVAAPMTGHGPHRAEIPSGS